MGDAAVRTALADEFCRLRPRAEAGQLAAGGVFALAVATWPPSAALVWLAALGLSVWGARALRRRRARASAAGRLGAARTGLALTAAVWCGGLLWFLPGSDAGNRSVVLLVIAGLFAALANTTSADTPSHRVFSVALLGGLLPPLLALGLWRDAAAACVFALVMEWLRGESQRGLRRRIAAQLRLERQEAQADRERRELEQLFEHSPWGFAVVDGASGRLRRTSRAFQALLGEERAQLAGRSLRDVLPGSSLIGEDPGREPVPLYRGDGSVTWLRLASADVGGADEPARLVLCEDVTASSLQQETERRYRELVETASDMVWRIDDEGRWSFLNQAAAGIYGRSLEQLLGRSFLEHVAPEALESSREALSRMLAGGSVVDYETVHLHASGEPRHLSFAAWPVRDVSGQVIGAEGIARDVTARRRAEDELKQLAIRAEHATRMKSEFLALMSHEIRTPLHAVLGMLELLLAAPLPDEQRGHAEVARDSAQALLTLLGDILDFSRVEAGRLEVEAAPFDLPEVLEGVGAMMSPLAAERGNRLEVELDPALPRRVTGDGGRLRQVVTNLVGNAGKFTENGQIRLRAWARPEAAGRVMIEVSDDGDGIEEERLEAIFEPFTQADSSVTRRFGGSGLGLAIARRLVDLMGGELQCRSAIGVGSAFSFSLPLPAVEDREPKVAASAAPAANGEAGPAGRLAVLLVEDNRVSQRVARLMLERRGHEVTVADDGHQALEAAAAHRFDVVLMDVQMPGMDGLQATAVLRARGLGSLPIVALTAHAYAEERERCLAAGMDDFLTKPFKMEDLSDVVERWGQRAAAGRGAPPRGDAARRPEADDATGLRAKAQVAARATAP